MLAERYRDHSSVIGADLHNEPHGQLHGENGDVRTDWHLAAKRVGNAILSVNPNWMIIVKA